MRICQLDGCGSSLEGRYPHTKYCCDRHRNRHKARLWYKPKTSRGATCRLDGCKNSILGTHGNKRYCCTEHRYKDHSIKNKKSRKFDTCQLDGCEISLKGRHRSTIYCCKIHKEKAYDQKPEVKAYRKKYRKSYSQTEEFKAKKRAYRQRPERVTYRKAYDQRPDVKARKKAYEEQPNMKAYRAEYRRTEKQKGRKQTEEYKARNRAKYHRRVARERALTATFTVADWQQALISFHNRCAYCGSEGELHQEHFIPVMKGGSYTSDNIIPSCPKCNFSKSDKAPENWCTPEQYERIVHYLVQLQGL